MTASPSVRQGVADSPVADVADWLAGVFRAPLRLEAIAAYRASDGNRLLDAIAVELGARQGIARMREALSLGDSVADTHRRLSHAYSILFDGIGGSRTVSLHESHYVDGVARRFREAAGVMERLLHRASLTIREEALEPADHLSVELALLATCLRRLDDDGRDFSLQRLSSWAPEFRAACTAADPTGFYAGASTALCELLASMHLLVHQPAH
jgi:TorA-specific chaperone